MRACIRLTGFGIIVMVVTIFIAWNILEENSRKDNEIQKLKQYLAATALENPPLEGDYRIIPIYFYPKDEEIDYRNLEEINQTVAILQSWYRERLKGSTFKFMPAKALRGNHEAAWYQSGKGKGSFDPVALDSDLEKILLAGSTSKTDYFVVFVADAKSFLVGDKSATGYALIYTPQRAGWIVVSTRSSLVVVAHELGHAFGLMHPKNPQHEGVMNSRVDISLWEGIFSREEIKILEVSSLITK